MAEIIRKAIRGYKLLFIDITDPRTQNWFLVAKPYQGLLLLGVYLMFIFRWGPRWMKNRPPFNMDRILIAYNAIQAIICAALFLKGLRFWGYGGIYRWVCEPVDFTNSEDGLLKANLAYYYFLLKVFDLLDTVFFVLRKKFNQVSFLHVYHHTGMVMLIWAAVTYYPGGHGSFIGVVNCFVHTVMYTYYLLTIIMPSVKNMMWVKKLVTQLQIIQFFIFVVHMTTIIFKPDCQYPRWTAAIFLPQNVFMLILFIDFYIKTYVKKPKAHNNRSENNGSFIHNTNGEIKELVDINKKIKNGGVIMSNGNGIGNVRMREENMIHIRVKHVDNNVDR